MAAKEKSQRERFIEKAKELGADDEESAEAFERAFKKITRPTTRESKEDNIVTSNFVRYQTKDPAFAGSLDNDNI